MFCKHYKKEINICQYVICIIQRRGDGPPLRERRANRTIIRDVFLQYFPPARIIPILRAEYFTRLFKEKY